MTDPNAPTWRTPEPRRPEAAAPAWPPTPAPTTERNDAPTMPATASTPVPEPTPTIPTPAQAWGPSPTVPTATSPEPAPMTPAWNPQPPADGQHRARHDDEWNGLAIAGFICSFLLGLVGLILSIIGLNQIGRHGGKGKGLAIAGIIIGALGTLASLLLVVALILGVAASDTGGASAPTTPALPRTSQPATPKQFASMRAYVGSSMDKAFLLGVNGSLEDTGGHAASSLEDADTIRYDITMPDADPATAPVMLDGMRTIMGNEAKRLDKLVTTTDGVHVHLRILTADGSTAAERTYTAADAG